MIQDFQMTPQRLKSAAKRSNSMEVLSAKELGRRVRCWAEGNDSKCKYAEWNRVNKGLLNVCLRFGARFNALDGSGDFSLGDDWFGVREICIAEMNTSFVSNALIDEVQDYLRSLQPEYRVSICSGDAALPIQYEAILWRDAIWCTALEAPSTTTAKKILAELKWFRGPS